MTNDEIIAVADATRTDEPGDNGYILPISFARAIIKADRAQRQAEQPADEYVGWLATQLGGDEPEKYTLASRAFVAGKAVGAQRQAEPYVPEVGFGNIALIDQVANSVLLGNAAPQPTKVP